MISIRRFFFVVVLCLFSVVVYSDYTYSDFVRFKNLAEQGDFMEFNLKAEGCACGKQHLFKSRIIIGENAEIRHCAFIRGNAIVGNNAVVGKKAHLPPL